MPSLRFKPSTIDNVEYAEDYRPGGFHPVAINNIFAEGRYRVVHKLGCGGSSTIWLAREQHGGLVAIKVMRSDSSSSIKENPEWSIPRYLSSLDPGARIQIPQDYFIEHGPNGSHLCLVYQLAGPSILSMSFCAGRYEGSRRLKKDLAMKVAKQLVCTVELIHNSGFAHGGLCQYFMPEERLIAKTIQTLPQPMSCSALLKTLQSGPMKNFI